jgi:hypothetical protein
MKHSPRLKGQKTTRKRPYGDLPGWFAKTFPIEGSPSLAPQQAKPKESPEN